MEISEKEVIDNIRVNITGLNETDYLFDVNVINTTNSDDKTKYNLKYFIVLGGFKKSFYNASVKICVKNYDSRVRDVYGLSLIPSCYE